MKTIQQQVQLLEEALQQATEPVERIDLLNSIAYEIRHIDSERSIQKSGEAAALATSISYQKGIATALLHKGFGEMVQAKYAEAFQTLQEAVSIFETLHDEGGRAQALYNIGIVYSRIGEYNQGLEAFEQSLAIQQSLGDEKGISICLNQLGYINERFGNIAQSYDYYDRCLALQRKIDNQAGVAATVMAVGLLKQKEGRYKEAEADLQESLSIRQQLGETHGWLVSMNYLGEFYIAVDKLAAAEPLLLQALDRALQQVPPFPANLCRLYTSLAKVYVGYQKYDEAVQQLQQALHIAAANRLNYQLYDIHLTLSGVYKQKGDYREALLSYEQYHLAKEEVINLSASTKLKNLELSNRIVTEKKNAEIQQLRNIELKAAYEQLQKTQEQLVQAEKLAYLGQLTTGIAHEIQNPLNFVHNFSEVSIELCGELHEEIRNGNHADALSLTEVLTQNMDKINHHSNRASAIISAMLLHARTTSNEKQLTDINALVDEYLRLSYQELLTKDPTCNAQWHTHFDTDIQKIQLVPQEIGRVLLNLFSNAFYAVAEKQKRGLPGYEPNLWVCTRQGPKEVTITVRDNGMGIPPTIIEKIFQPFFTTKPTGQGTGLGLSLSYDIMKAYGGDLTVHTEAGVYTEFRMLLPRTV